MKERGRAVGCGSAGRRHLPDMEARVFARVHIVWYRTTTCVAALTSNYPDLLLFTPDRHPRCVCSCFDHNTNLGGGRQSRLLL